MTTAKEIKQVEKLIEDFIDVMGKMTLKQVSNEIDQYKNLSIALFEKKRLNYSLSYKKLIREEIELVETKYKDFAGCIEEIMAIGFNEAVSNSSTIFSQLIFQVSFKNYTNDLDFSDLEILHTCSLYNDPFHFLGKKNNNLNKKEVNYEIALYLIWGINDCYYLMWLYDKLDNITNGQGIEKREEESGFLKVHPDIKISNVDPLDLIDPYLLPLFLEAEKKATSPNLKFPSLNRCAAWCELLYQKKYLINVNNENRKTMGKFAKARYGLNIDKALESSKKNERNEHKTIKKGKLPPLKNAF
jgi:hypothetical protein